MFQRYDLVLYPIWVSMMMLVMGLCATAVYGAATDRGTASQFFTADDNPRVVAGFTQTESGDGNVIWHSEDMGPGDVSIVFRAETIDVVPVDSATAIENAIVFDGTVVADAAAYRARNATFEFWIKPSDLEGSEWIFETGGGGNGLVIKINDTTLLTAVENDGGTVVRSELTTDQIEDFIQVVSVHDHANSQLRLYVNGQLEDSINVELDKQAAGTNGSGFGGVGGGSSAGRSSGMFEGKLAVFRYYNSALNDEQVAERYQDFAGGSAVAGNHEVLPVEPE